MKGRATDEIRVINATHEENINAEISVYEKRNARWRTYGTATLNGISDTDRVSSIYSGSLLRFSHIAVTTDSENALTVAVKKAHNDIYIYLFSRVSMENLQSLDSKTVRGSFKDNVRVHNFSQEIENCIFDVFVRNSSSDPWIPAGIVYLKANGDSDILETPIKKIASYRYFALACEEEVDFSLDAEKVHNDLYIYIED